MAQSGRLAKALGILEKELGIDLGTDRDPTKVDSLGTALDFAMRTIDRACPTNSGRATELLMLAPDDPVRSELPCPAALPQKLAGYDYTKYRGYYHTDFTVPSLYFRPDVERPEDASPLELDFSYLFDNRLKNPDHVTLGTGRRIRAQRDDSEAAGSVHDTGTKKSRALHALASPFVCRGDNGRRQPNYSTLGGDLAAAAISNAYYPASNRGPGLFLGNFLIGTGERAQFA